MKALQIILTILQLISGLAVTIVVLLQTEEAPKTIGGGGVSKKSRGLDALLAKLTKVAAIVFMVLAVVLVLLQRFF